MQRLRLGRIAMLALLAVMTSLVVTATPAAAAGTYQMRSAAMFSHCLDADYYGGGANGTKVHLWECATSLPSWQRWSFESRGNGIWKIHSSNGGRCLDADISGGPVRNGTKVHLWDCWETSNQLWYQYLVNGRYLLVNGGPGQPYCLDADASRPIGNGTLIHLWQCNTSANQQSWPLIEV